MVRLKVPQKVYGESAGVIRFARVDTTRLEELTVR